MSCRAPYIIWEKIKQYEIEIVKRRCSSIEIEWNKLKIYPIVVTAKITTNQGPAITNNENPYAFTNEQIQQLKKSGTLVLGYVSVLELEAWHKPQVVESDYYYRDGKKMKIEQWDTYIMNLADEHYRGIVVNKVKQQIIGKGIDGVFLDTAGDIDDYFYNQPATQEKFREAYANLLKEIKSIDSNLFLIQNWGFETIKNTSLNLIHGVLWEDFNKQVITNDKWSQNWMRYFKQQSNKIVTFTVTPDNVSKEYSFTNGFIATINPNDIYDK